MSAIRFGTPTDACDAEYRQISPESNGVSRARPVVIPVAVLIALLRAPAVAAASDTNMIAAAAADTAPPEKS